MLITLSLLITLAYAEDEFTSIRSNTLIPLSDKITAISNPVIKTKRQEFYIHSESSPEAICRRFGFREPTENSSLYRWMGGTEISKALLGAKGDIARKLYRESSGFVWASVICRLKKNKFNKEFSSPLSYESAEPSLSTTLFRRPKISIYGIPLRLNGGSSYDGVCTALGKTKMSSISFEKADRKTDPNSQVVLNSKGIFSSYRDSQNVHPFEFGHVNEVIKEIICE